MRQPQQIILGSRSPQRRELLGHLFPTDEITVLPPRSSEEAGFEGLNSLAAIEDRLEQIAQHKLADVLAQVQASQIRADLIVTADTTIIAHADQGHPVVLGTPPDTEPDYSNTVRHWFERYLLGQTHLAVTAVCLRRGDGGANRQVVRTSVKFHSAPYSLVEWYISTGEPRGKAGGYGIQGRGSLFVSGIEGSLTNVIGLPVLELREMLDTLEEFCATSVP